MPTRMFVNLPVTDLPRSMAFYEALGFTINPQFTDAEAACVVISDHLYAMLLTHGRFAQFTRKRIADAHATTEVLVALGCDDREEVVRMCEAAFAKGGRPVRDAQDHGFMFAWAFEDPDGHVWEPMWMDPAHVQPME